MTNTRKWAVTNAGYFTGGTEVYTTLYQYNSSNNSEFTNTLDSKLFQTARLSPSSLRYYGLGLKNGNYNVTLQFAEIAFQNSAMWRSLGRRVFDIYIQVCTLILNCCWITMFIFKVKNKFEICYNFFFHYTIYTYKYISLDKELSVLYF